MNQGSSSSEGLRVYFDGLCRVCSREIEHYRKMKGAEGIQFIDITSTNFNAVAEDLDPKQIHQVMHVKDQNGVLHLGLDAFIRIWEELPSIRFLSSLARIPGIYWLMKIFYKIFSWVRPWLPRKSCESSPYCDTSRF